MGSTIRLGLSRRVSCNLQALKLEEQQLLGEASCTLSEIAMKLYRTVTLDLAHEDVSAPAHTRKYGQLTIYAEESDPFLVISKPTEHGILVPICKIEVLKNDHDPKWKQIFLSIQQVGSKDSPLLIECFNFNSNGKLDLLGKVQKSLADLERLHWNGRKFAHPDVWAKPPTQGLKE